MTMTHPDILNVEKYGNDFPEPKKVIGTCEYCGSEIHEDDQGYIECDEGYFCNTDCFFEHHGVEVINGGW